MDFKNIYNTVKTIPLCETHASKVTMQMGHSVTAYGKAKGRGNWDKIIKLSPFDNKEYIVIITTAVCSPQV